MHQAPLEQVPVGIVRSQGVLVALAEHGVEQNVALRVPHFVVIPLIVAGTDLIVSLPAHVADVWAGLVKVKVHPLPISIPSFDVSLYWHARVENDAANRWLRNAMLELFGDWQAQRSAEVSEDAAIKAQLVEFVTRHGEAHFSELGIPTDKVRDRAGWWRQDGEARVWLFTAEGLRRAVPGFEQRTVLDVLDAAGWIAERDKSGKRSKRVKAEGRALWLYHLRPVEC